MGLAVADSEWSDCKFFQDFSHVAVGDSAPHNPNHYKLLHNMKIEVSAEMHTVCPEFIGACVTANIKNTEYSEELWREIDALGEEFRATLTTESLKTIGSIQATRRVYRLCGKDPSRYRPSGEALVRRVLQGKQLYHIDTLVDLINLASMKYGYSIGAFDADKFSGDTLTLGIGREGEPYEGIGRGMINIAGLPVYRDAVGGVGTPTSDNERTKVSLSTTRLLVLVNGYDGNEQSVLDTAEYIVRLVGRYCAATDCSYTTYR